MGRDISIGSSGQMIERRTKPDSGLKKFALDMAGRTGGLLEQQAQLQQMTQLMCEVTGGTWDATTGTCVPKEDPVAQYLASTGAGVLPGVPEG